jgi:hypothetical protein
MFLVLESPPSPAVVVDLEAPARKLILPLPLEILVSILMSKTPLQIM